MIKLLLYGLAVLVLLPPVLVAGALAGNRLPLTDPPGLGHRLKTYLTTNVAETSPDSPFPELRPPVFAVPAERLFDAVEAACRRLGWSVVSASPDDGALSAVVATPLWGFKDDIQILVRPAVDGGSGLQVRSSSRVGKGDLGANTRHILDLLGAVREVIQESGTGAG